MPKIPEQWLLYKYVGLEFTPLSKPFKTKEAAEKARLKFPERERGAIGVGVIRLQKYAPGRYPESGQSATRMSGAPSGDLGKATVNALSHHQH
jgi:hypothetical protein